MVAGFLHGQAAAVLATPSRALSTHPGEVSGPTSMQLTMLGSIRSPNDDPNDPDHGPKGDPDSFNRYPDLNHRQIWFLRQLNSGRSMRAEDLRRQHNVSEKTAKRDIAGLRQKKIIKYVGSHRKGQYLPIQ
jgi:predicted HTH transcriptional regulator